MKLITEIPRAINYINAQDTKNPKDEEEKKNLSDMILQDFKSNSFDFSQIESIVLNQNGKKRFAKRFTNIYSTENILCQCIKQILDREFKVKYPNRNKISKTLFNFIGTIKNMSDFTILKFDFKNYFNSVSSAYVYEKILRHQLSDRFEIDLIKKFVNETKYSYAGLQTSNAIAEIIAKVFDEEIVNSFSSFGLLYFERYIDDGIIVLNEHLSETKCNEILLDALKKTFYDENISELPKCTTKMNLTKFKYISKRKMIPNQSYTIDFLGYNFILKKDNNSVNIKYGITEEKRNKYSKRLKSMIELFLDPASPDYNKLELLRHRILAFTSREVYMTKKFKSNIWKVKGFISNYGELRYLLSTSLIDTETEQFLKNMVTDAFIQTGISLPYFLKNKSSEAYSLYYNMKKNKTLLFVEHIGYNEKSLIELCNRIEIDHIDSNGKRRGYGTLVRDYLIKTKVGY